MMKTVKFICLCLMIFAIVMNASATVSSFDDLTLAPNSYWNGSDGSGGFTSGSATYNNYFDDTYGAYWEGFAYSDRTDTTSIGLNGQYSAIAGGAYSGDNYGVVYCGFYGSPHRNVGFSNTGEWVLRD